jgi:2-amino-4-hydroxy-6-hydroxymethyldihydropteridine diphosphokinase
VFLKRIVDDKHSIYVNRNFPKKLSPHKAFRHRVILGIGGNVGDTRRRIEHLWITLGRLSQVKRMQSGVILKNPPFGYLTQDDFYNTVFEISTSLSPRQLLRLMWRIEKRFGRVRSFANAPRTLDVDIIFFDDQAVDYPELKIPHPHWEKRSSVIIPLQSMIRNTIRRRYENLNV